MRFLVLPDHRLGAVAAGVPSRHREPDGILTHASGRPWVVGSWADDEILTASVGTRRVALLGCFAATPGDLARVVGHCATLDRLGDALRAIPGSYHTLASFDGETRAQGSLSGVREIFHTTVDGLTLAADRPDPLAALSGGEVDETTVVCHLLAQPPWPLTGRTAWRSVSCLRPGHWLRVRRDGSHHTVRWWSPPPADQPIGRSARQVLTALRGAVSARTRSGVVGCDLSGGLDSTSLALLTAADEGCRRLVTVRKDAVDPANDDAWWARQAAGYLPDAESLVLPWSQVPHSFAGRPVPEDDLEAPYAWWRTTAAMTYVAERLAAREVSVHLTGHGGDELFHPAPSFFHALARRAPLRSLTELRVARSMYRWPLGALVRNLLRDPSYGQWLHAASRSLTTPIRGPREPLTGWGHHPRLPFWVTAPAADVCRRLLRDAAERGAEPHSPDPAQHEVVQAVRRCGTSVRLTDRLTSRSGVSYHAPYLDDQVLEAALTLRLTDRTRPGLTKPLLTAALRGTVPDPVLERTTKGEFSADVYAGVRRHRRELLELGEDMRLARLGLVDPVAVRSVLLAPHPTPRSFIPMVSTLACESWLRSVEAARERTGAAKGIR
ncbi:asparagine synthase [Streptomyces sp. ISL-12]|uniref:asparagine synthase-related protein n=1 Tax=Streptomyces sp. ISL-12 TaxID=2819177 RepID=UPI001BE66895|nr:asparagine synthase-related protein [Streptomyces sp. ISL-12]MBT2409923.1 asparagine synthase [Streptomyces sp. ISL-12]